MAKYIERENLVDEIRSLSVSLAGNNVFDKVAKESVLRVIDEQPTADVVEVVRCKNCTHFVKRNEKPSFCFLRRRHIKENDFCSDGELKEREGK